MVGINIYYTPNSMLHFNGVEHLYFSSSQEKSDGSATARVPESLSPQNSLQFNTNEIRGKKRNEQITNVTLNS